VRDAILMALTQARPGEREARVTHLANRSLTTSQDGEFDGNGREPFAGER
jgi:hypothetical protein